MGFQYEPEREDNDITDPTFDDSDNAEGDKKDEIKNARSISDIKTWCKCGKCKLMPTEKECLCCTEIDAIKYFHLNGK